MAQPRPKFFSKPGILRFIVNRLLNDAVRDRFVEWAVHRINIASDADERQVLKALTDMGFDAFAAVLAGDMSTDWLLSRNETARIVCVFAANNLEVWLEPEGGTDAIPDWIEQIGQDLLRNFINNVLIPAIDNRQLPVLNT